MGIYLNVSNSVAQLANQLANNLQQSSHLGTMMPQWLVTQTEGINGWLKMNIAQQLGITANIHFYKPNDVVARLFLWTAAGNASLVMDKETLKWHIYAILEEPAFIHRFPDIASFYAQDGVKQISLATELADLFDQYQVYRHTVIADWNAAFDHQQVPSEWQPYVWYRLRTLLGNQYIDRVQIVQTILAQLQVPAYKTLVQKRLPQLHFFGIAVITPYFLQMYKALAAVTDIHLYLTNPAPEQFWMDDATEKQIARLRNSPSALLYAEKNVGNDLLLNWGQIIKTSFGLLLNDEGMINSYDAALAIPPENGPLLLHKIQHDIYNNAAHADRNTLLPTNITDGSIVINGAYTPVREVEILYNHLSAYLLQHNGQYSARDILVLVTDIDKYAPYIHAVFKNAPFTFPYSIADESIIVDNNLFTALRDILLIDAEMFKTEDVLELLDSPYIRSRFGITDVDALRLAVRQANIIFGIDGRLEDDTYLVSWTYGLKKILYGICMSGEVDFYDGTHTITPLDTAEGAAVKERIQLIHFVQVLQFHLQQRQQARTLVQWADYLKTLVSELVFEAGEKDDEDYPKLIDLLEQLSQMEPLSQVSIGFEAFRHSFLQQLALQQTTQVFTGPGITFCSLVPMRSIPFSIIAMLGMDFDKFPRKQTQRSFSLIAQNPQTGDRNIKDNDKHLFLETLLSAKHHFYISYLARNEKDGTPMPASSLVDELIDYVARGLQTDTDELRNQWVTIHPLHSFSKKYFTQPNLVTFLSEDRYKTRIPIRTASNEAPAFDFSVIPLQQLCHFVRNPIKTYLNKRLNIYYYDEEILLPDHELFELNSLDKWTLWQEAIALTPQNRTAYIEKLRQNNRIPLKHMGEAAFEQFLQDADAFIAHVQKNIDNQPERSIDVQLTIEQSLIAGKVNSIYQNNFISICYSNDLWKYLLAAYVQYLALVAQGENMAFTFIFKDIEQTTHLPIGSISTADALVQLKQLIQFYEQGHHHYLPFFPAFANKNCQMLAGNYEQFIKALQQAMDNEQSFVFSDVYLQQAFADGVFAENNYPQVQTIAKQLLQPLQTLMPHLFQK